MAIMNRNVNLEEINTDAFMGISYLNFQSVPQKIIFILGVVIAIAINLLGNFLWNINTMAIIGVSLIPLLICVLFGCNYNEDLSLFRYIVLIVSNPVKHLNSKPTEDLESLRNKATLLKQEEEALASKSAMVTNESQRRLIKVLVFGVIAFIVFIVAFIVAINLLKDEDVHHTVSSMVDIIGSNVGA